MTPHTPPARRHGLAALPRAVWVLGFVSMLMDVSSEMIHSLLPVYLVSVLGASALAVGIIEGFAEATANVTKIVSGALSDRLGRRKSLAALGYGIAALSKPLFPLAGSLGLIVAARFLDRLGKGIRGAPRDALIVDVAPPDLRGTAFGLRQSLDTVGAVVGPLIAIGLMALFSGDYAAVFWVAALPAALSALLILFAVREPDRAAAAPPPRRPLSRQSLGRLPAAFWWVLGAAILFTLARFSEAFLLLRAQGLGVAALWIPLVLVLLNIAYALSAYPAGVLSDRVDRVRVLAIGLVILIVADLVLALSNGLAGIAAGTLLWGVHLGFTQGVFAALVSDAAPAELRGTAFGLFYLATGLALLVASVLAGALWDLIGPHGTFTAGAGFALLTLCALWPMRARLPSAARGQDAS